MGWSYNFWVGNFYPRGLKSEGFLTEYSKHFNTVEVDSTFYRVPSEKTITRWKEQTPQDFLFSVKVSKTITHEKMLRDCEKDWTFFIERLTPLQDKLGPLLFQFPPAFGSKQFHLLEDFLPTLPKRFRYVVEVRNKKLLESKFYSLLRKNRVALATVTNPLLPNVEEITADFVYVRWEGDRKKVNGTGGAVEVDRTRDIKEWADKIQNFLKQSEDVFGYFSKYYSGHPPTDAKQLIRLL